MDPFSTPWELGVEKECIGNEWVKDSSSLHIKCLTNECTYTLFLIYELQLKSNT